MTANPQESFPMHLQYRRDEEVVRAEQILSSSVQAMAQKLNTTNHVNPKQFAEQHLVPVVTSIVQFFSMQHGDLLKFTQNALIHQLEQQGAATETMVGIPPDDVEAMCDELERIDRFMVKVDTLGGNKKELLEEVKKEARELRVALGDLAEAIQEYTLEDVEDEEDFVEFDESEEEPEASKEAANA